MLRYMTAGESHGRALIAVLEGMPAGLKIDPRDIDAQLKRRQKGYGRGARMKIESDKVQILSGVRKGETIGSPIALMIENKDFKIDMLPPVTCPRPGHADLAGIIKYNRKDARDILERASARETAARTAAGAVCRLLLEEIKVDIFSHTKFIDGISANAQGISFDEMKKRAERSSLNCVDKYAEGLMIKMIERARQKGDTVGGGFEVIALGLPAGLGSHVHYDRKLNARLALELMSIQAIKGVEFGLGAEGCRLFGSQFHDAIYLKGKNIVRRTNNAGGIEGGMTNGLPLRVTCAMKPISTLINPLPSVDVNKKVQKKASVERSDICAVPAAAVVAENVTAFVLAQALLEKFGGDSMEEVVRNYKGYINF